MPGRGPNTARGVAVGRSQRLLRSEDRCGRETALLVSEEDANLSACGGLSFRSTIPKDPRPVLQPRPAAIGYPLAPGGTVQVTFYRHLPGRPFRQFPAGWCRSPGFPVDVA